MSIREILFGGNREPEITDPYARKLWDIRNYTLTPQEAKRLGVTEKGWSEAEIQNFTVALKFASLSSAMARDPKGFGSYIDQMSDDLYTNLYPVYIVPPLPDKKDKKKPEPESELRPNWHGFAGFLRVLSMAEEARELVENRGDVYDEKVKQFEIEARNGISSVNSGVNIYPPRGSSKVVDDFALPFASDPDSVPPYTRKLLRKLLSLGGESDLLLFLGKSHGPRALLNAESQYSSQFKPSNFFAETYPQEIRQLAESLKSFTDRLAEPSKEGATYSVGNLGLTPTEVDALIAGEELVFKSKRDDSD